MSKKAHKSRVYFGLFVCYRPFYRSSMEYDCTTWGSCLTTPCNNNWHLIYSTSAHCDVRASFERSNMPIRIFTISPHAIQLIKWTHHGKCANEGAHTYSSHWSISNVIRLNHGQHMHMRPHVRTHILQIFQINSWLHDWKAKTTSHLWYASLKINTSKLRLFSMYKHAKCLSVVINLISY